MSLFCSICKNDVPEGFGQCLACKAGFAPQLACSTCKRLVPRGVATCSGCDRASRSLATLPAQSAPSQALTLPTLPTLAGVVAPLTAPPVLPGLPAHVGLSSIPEIYSAGRFGVSADVQVPALDVSIMNDMNKVVVVAHTVAARISSSLMQPAGLTTFSSSTELSTSVRDSSVPTVVEIMNEMAQLVVILHSLADRINHFQGFMESTRNVIRLARLLATDLQGEIESWKMTKTWTVTESIKSVIRQCRVFATELQEEIETRRGPRG